MSQSKKIFVNIDKCLGCHTCEIECAIAHSNTKDLLTAISETPLPQYRINTEYFEGENIPFQCRHCEDAPCVTVCPTEAITRKEGEIIVSIDEEKCIGCMMCIQVCPFGVLKSSRENGVVTKCDLCIERLNEGKNPACVEACPTNALSFLTEVEMSKKRREEAGKKILAAFRRGSSAVKEETSF